MWCLYKKTVVGFFPIIVVKMTKIKTIVHLKLVTFEYIDRTVTIKINKTKTKNYRHLVIIKKADHLVNSNSCTFVKKKTAFKTIWFTIICVLPLFHTHTRTWYLLIKLATAINQLLSSVLLLCFATRHQPLINS